MRGDPPSDYEIEFRVRSLCVGYTGDLQYVDTVTMRISLPPNFPYGPPTVQPVQALFHPNVSYEGVHLSTPWQTTDTIVEGLVLRTGLYAYPGGIRSLSLFAGHTYQVPLTETFSVRYVHMSAPLAVRVITGNVRRRPRSAARRPRPPRAGSWCGPPA